MTTFLRLLAEDDKAAALAESCVRVRQGTEEGRCFEVAPENFDAVPGKPFAYWVSTNIRAVFVSHPEFLSPRRTPTFGASTKNDFRYLRSSWELVCGATSEDSEHTGLDRWAPFAKGGSFSPFYAPIDLRINWAQSGRELKADISEYRGSRGWGYQWSAALNGHEWYFRPGLTWPRRTNGLSFRVMPTGCIFADKGPAAFVENDDPDELLALVCLLNSKAFGHFLIHNSAPPAR